MFSNTSTDLLHDGVLHPDEGQGHQQVADDTVDQAPVLLVSFC